MSKRTKNQPKIEAKKPKHWSVGLIDSMNNPEFIEKTTESAVVIRDKYPKAKIHYLVLAYDDIASIHDLSIKHMPLLKKFGEIFEQIKSEVHHPVKAGFHAVPSMHRLHMHIISNDMVSPCLKTKKHWNSFTTKFFKPYDDVLRELKLNGMIKKISKEDSMELLNTKLKCNQCSYTPKNMPDLKQHLFNNHNKI